MIRICASLIASLSVACSGAPQKSGQALEGLAQGATIRLQEVAQGLTFPVFLISPPGDRRLFVIEKPGRIRIVENGQLSPTPFLDITDRVGSSSNEQGLLGLAFHPGYASN